jgi:hypothetical protein
MKMILAVMWVVMVGGVMWVVTSPERALKGERKWIFLEKMREARALRNNLRILIQKLEKRKKHKREKVQNQRIPERTLKREKVQNQRIPERTLKREKEAIRTTILKPVMGTLKTRILLRIPIKRKIIKMDPIT